MNEAVLLHLTDLHFPGENSSEAVAHNNVFSALIDALAELKDNWKPTHVVVTGDITLKGCQAGYQHAERQLKKLLDVLKLDIERLFICPGNHDVQRDAGQVLDKALSSEEVMSSGDDSQPGTKDDAQKANELLTEDANRFSPLFDYYKSFCKSLGVTPWNLEGGHSYLSGSRLDDTFGLKFVALNSAWFCRGSKDKGRLWVGQNYVRTLLPNDRSDNYKVVTLLHHPWHWLHESETSAARLASGGRAKNTKDLIALNSDLIFTGHTHGEIRYPDRIAMGALHFTGGASGESPTHHNNVRLVRLENKHLVYRSLEYRPDQASEVWVPHVKGSAGWKEDVSPKREKRSVVGLRTFRDLSFDTKHDFDKVFDWSDHFSHSPSVLPDKATWKRLMTELQDYRNTATGDGVTIELTCGPNGSAGGSLSAGFVFGNVFRRFPLSVDQDIPDGVRQSWRTNAPVLAKNTNVKIDYTPLGHNGCLALLINITRAVRPGYNSYVSTSGLNVGAEIAVEWSGEGSINNKDAVQIAKCTFEKLREAISELGALPEIHVFYAGPYALAVMLGHAFNRVGKLYFYEYQGKYVEGPELFS